MNAMLRVALAALILEGCASHSERTLPMRTALDEGHPRAAIAALNEELEVKSDSDMPVKLEGDNALLVLDRASIQQSLAQFKFSQQDFQAADKAIDMLDLAHNAGDSIGKYVFSDSSGRYQAPPYEKLLINTLNMLNYLEQHDLDGAKIEARRLSVMQTYFKNDLKETDNAVLGLGGFLAGLAFEKAGEYDEALRYYDESLQFTGYSSLADPVRVLMKQGATYTSPSLTKLVADKPAPDPIEKTGEGEIVFVMGYGRVPHKFANRLPIGLVLTRFAWALSPADRATANQIALQGLVTWVNFPSLGKEQGGYALPACALDGSYVQLEEAVNVTKEVRAQWEKIEGQIIVSALTRMISRFAAGQLVKHAAGNGGVGTLLSLATQGTMTALDTPDTRSWETLPARVAIARVRVQPGVHHVRLEARGVSRTQDVTVDKGGWAVVSLMALR